jgi:hypothetical protein
MRNYFLYCINAIFRMSIVTIFGNSIVTILAINGRSGFSGKKEVRDFFD